MNPRAVAANIVREKRNSRFSGSSPAGRAITHDAVSVPRGEKSGGQEAKLSIWIAPTNMGGLPLVVQLGQKLVAREFGSDHLAGVSIVSSVILGEYLVGVIVILMLSGGTALERFASRRASSVLDALAKRMPQAAHKKDGTNLRDVPLREIAIGDELAVFPHEICPVDGVVVEGRGKMNEAYLTGEPFEIEKMPGSQVISGAINGDTAVYIRAEKAAVDSRFARIMGVMQDAEQRRPRIRRLADKLGAWYTLVALGLAAMAWAFSGQAHRFLAVVVVATPCPLLIAIPVAVIGAISLSARRGIIIKNPAVLEEIDRCRTLIFDKTGTLTYGKPSLSELLCAPGFAEHDVLRLTASLERYSKHPLSQAIQDAAEKANLPVELVSEISERPGEGLSGIVNHRKIWITSRSKMSAQHIALPPVTFGLECLVFIDSKYAAALRFHDTPRPESRTFIRHLKPRHAVNPLLEAYVAPPLDRIRPEHFLPALDTLMDKVAADFAALRDNPAPPTFANTVVPLEALLNPISDLRGILSLYVANASTDQLEEIEQTIDKKVSAFEKTLLQDSVLIRRFDAVYKNRAALRLDEDDKAILRDLHLSFEVSGAFLSASGQQRIRALDARLIELAKKFSENLKKDVARQAILVTDEVELAGINDGDRKSFAEAARKQGHAAAWLISPERSLVDSLLAQAENSSFRKKMFESLNHLGCDNHPVIDEMQAVRREYAQLLGYPTYAAAARSRYMMKDVGKVETFLAEMADAVILKKWDDVIDDIADFAARNGGPGNIEPWDTPYWAEKRRADLFHFDANAFSEYLALDNVLDGMFSEAGHLFGLTFKEIQGQPVIHPDVKVFDVRDKATGEQIGLLHADFYARPDTGDGAPVKRGGAWMSQLQSKASGRPNIVGFNMNIIKPTRGGTALLSLGQYTTAYHELGHALQGLRGTKVKYRSLQGTAAPSDFTEFHSMVNERRATLKENLKAHALHYQTGQPPTDQTIDALIKSQSYYTELRGMLLLVQNSRRDLAFHIAAAGTYASAEALQDAMRLKTPYADHVRPYPLTRFTHLFDSSHSYYAAGYCNYLIANVHAADGFEPFEKDPYDLSWSKRLSDLYNRGSGGEPLELYRAYRGRDANPAALLRVVGEGVLKARGRSRSSVQTKPRS